MCVCCSPMRNGSGFFQYVNFFFFLISAKMYCATRDNWEFFSFLLALTFYFFIFFTLKYLFQFCWLWFFLVLAFCFIQLALTISFIFFLVGLDISIISFGLAIFFRSYWPLHFLSISFSAMLILFFILVEINFIFVHFVFKTAYAPLPNKY